MSSSDQLQPSHGTFPSAAIVGGAARPLPRRSPTPTSHLVPVDVTVSCDAVIPRASLLSVVEDGPPNLPADEPCAAGLDSLLDPSVADTERVDRPLDPPLDVGGSKPVARERSSLPPGRLAPDAPPPSNDAPGAAAGGDQDREGGEPPTDASAAAVDPIPGFPADLVPVVGPELSRARGADATHMEERRARGAVREAAMTDSHLPEPMAAPKTGYTPIPHVIFDRWQARLTSPVFRMLCCIARHTWGWGKTWDKISTNQFCTGQRSKDTGESINDGAGVSAAAKKKAIHDLCFTYGIVAVRYTKSDTGADGSSEYALTKRLMDGWHEFSVLEGGRGSHKAPRGSHKAPDLREPGEGLQNDSQGGFVGAPQEPVVQEPVVQEKEEAHDSPLPSFGEEEKAKTFSEDKVKVKVKVKTMAAAPPQPRNTFQEGFRGRIFAAILKAFPEVYSEENRAAIEACCEHPIFVAHWRTIIHKNRHLPYGDPWPFKKKDNQWNFLNIHQRVYDSRLEEGYKHLEPTPWERFSDHKMTLEFRAQAVGLRGHPEFREEWLDWLQSDQHEDYKFYESMYDDQINSLEQQVAYYENLIPEKRYSTRRNDLEDRAAGGLKKPEFREEWERRLLEARANPLDHGPLDWLAQQMIGCEKKFDDREDSLLDRADAVGLMNQPEFRREWRALSPEAHDRWWDQRALDWMEQQVVDAEQAKRVADELSGDAV